MSILRAFTEFPNEAALVGRLLVGYSDIEITLMNCVKSVRQDLDTVLKAMFRARGETRRIDVADAFGRQVHRELGLGTQFEMAIGAVRHCMRIRNQYAHGVWWNDYSGKLAFANLEELAKSNKKVDGLEGLTRSYVTINLLEKQLEYYEYTSKLLIWLIQEANKISGRTVYPDVVQPAQRPQPPLLDE